MKNYQQTPRQRRVVLKAAKQALRAAKRGGVSRTPSLEKRLTPWQPLPRWTKFYGFGVYW